jgi:uncharacterized protein (TIRG00374 family)
MKKLLIGILFSAVFLYLSLRGVQWGKILEGLDGVRYVYLLPAALATLVSLVLRSVRWGVILSPIAKVGQKRLMPITFVGFLAIVLVPMRIGEAMRPYLLSSAKIAPFSSALATIFVERVFDLIALLGILLVVVMFSPVPPWLLKSGYSSFGALVLLVMFMCALYLRTDFTLRLLGPVLRVLPHRYREMFEAFVRRFVEGFSIIASPGRLLGTVVLSLAIWAIYMLGIYFLFFFQGLQLSLFAAGTVLIVTVIGISIPTAPGMVGNFQFACIVALTLFNIPKDDAFLFSMFYYMMGIVLIMVLGLACFPAVNISIRDIVRDLKRGFKPAPERQDDNQSLH